MYQVSENYLSKVYAASTRHVLNVYLNGNKVESKYILGFNYNCNVFTNEELIIGSAPWSEVEIKIYNSAIPIGMEVTRVYIETGIEGETFPIGFYNVDDIKRTDFTTTFSLIDDMVKLDYPYDGSTLFSEEKNSATLMEVWNDICNKFEIESGIQEFTGDDIEIAVYDSTLTARQYVGYIAEQAGGFAIFGRDGKLYIRKIGETVVQYNKVYLKQRF